MTNDEAGDAVTNRDVAKGAGTTLLARLGGVIDVVVQPLYVWMFGLASYGIYAVFWSAINLITNIADLGMTTALQRTVPKADSAKTAASALRAAFILGVGPCIFVACAVSMSAASIAPVFNASPQDTPLLAHAIRVFIWVLPLWAFVEIATSALRAKRSFGPEIRLRLFWEQIARCAFAASFWSFGLSTMALFYAHMASLGVISLLCIRLLSKHFDLRLLFSGPVLDQTWTDTTKAGLAVLPQNIVGRIFGDAPQLILNTLLPGTTGATAAALYVIARKISSIVQLVRTAFSYVIAPLASLASTSRMETVRGIYGFATRVSIAFVLPLAATMAGGSDAILDVFGADTSGALPALVILIVARAIEAIFGNAAPIQQVIGGYRGQLVGSITGLCVAVAIGLFLMPDVALTGIALAVAIGIVIAGLIPVWQLAHYERIHPFTAPFGAVIMKASAVAAIGLLAALSMHGLPTIAHAPVLLFIVLGSIWASARLALPLADRQTLGRTGQRLRLH